MSSLFFDSTPGPSPWYLRDGATPLAGFQWRAAAKGDLSAGKTLLVGQSGPVAILNFYNYVLALDDSTLLIWNQRHVEAGPTDPVVMTIVRPRALSPLPANLDGVFARMNDRRDPLGFASSPTSQFRISTTDAEDQVGVYFPPEITHLDEILILCHSSLAESNPTWERSDLTLMVARPRESSVRLYPQDWFNAGGLDYGYQWVTRVARDPRTGRVHGEGIRIAPFVLDESLRRQAT